MHAGITSLWLLWIRWHGKRSRYSRYMRKNGSIWPPFRRRHFKCTSLNQNIWILIKISLFVPKGPIENKQPLMQVIAWWPTRQQAIIWTIHVSRGLNESSRQGLAKPALNWGRHKIAAIFQRTFSNVFSWMKMYQFRLRFHWSLLPRVQLTIFQHWFR